jgi:hypothetical protein
VRGILGLDIGRLRLHALVADRRNCPVRWSSRPSGHPCRRRRPCTCSSSSGPWRPSPTRSGSPSPACRAPSSGRPDNSWPVFDHPYRFSGFPILRRRPRGKPTLAPRPWRRLLSRRPRSCYVCPWQIYSTFWHKDG